MIPEPNHDLSRAMIDRASDLVAYMHQRGISFAVASDRAANGVQVTVLMAIGVDAGPLRDAGQKIAHHVAEEKQARAGRAKNN